MADSQAQTSANLSCLNTTYYGLLNPDQIHRFYFEEVVQTYGSDLITSWMQLSSSDSTRPAQTYYHTEQGRLNDPITTGGGSGIAGASVTLTLSSGYTGSGTLDPLQVGYGLFQASTGNTYIITAINTAVANAHTATIAPPTAAIAISIASGEQLVIVPLVFVNGCSTVTNSSQRQQGVVFSNTMQQYRRDLCICDTDLVNFSKDVEFFENLNPLTGESTWVWWHAEMGRVEAEYRNGIEFVLLTGKNITNTALTTTYGAGNLGLIPTITSYGNTQNYAAGIGFQNTDFNSMFVTMEKNNAPAEYIAFGGVELNLQMQGLLKSQFPNGAYQYDSFEGGKDQAVKWGFTSYDVSFGRTVHFHNMRVFNMPNYLGVAGGNYIGSAIWMPSSKLPINGHMMNYVEKVTLAGNGFDLGFQRTFVDGTGFFAPNGGGAYGQNVNSTTRAATFTWTSMTGIEVFAAKQLYYVQRS